MTSTAAPQTGADPAPSLDDPQYADQLYRLAERRGHYAWPPDQWPADVRDEISAELARAVATRPDREREIDACSAVARAHGFHGTAHALAEVRRGNPALSPEDIKAILLGTVAWWESVNFGEYER